MQGREQLSRNLLERTLDMAFVFDPIKTEELECKKVSDIMLLFVSTQLDTIESVFQHHYVSIDWGVKFIAEQAKRHPQFKSPYLKTSSAKIALDFILEKGESAYLPDQMVEPFFRSRQLYCVEGIPEWQQPVYLSYRKNSASIETIQQVEAVVTRE